MNIIVAVILGIIEGLTEFLPISSTGHLILVSSILSLPQSTYLKTFEIVIQGGAILAVLYLYAGKLIRNFTLWTRIIIAFLPGAFFGFILYKLIKDVLMESQLVVVTTLFIGGIILIFSDKITPKQKTDIDKLSYPRSFIIGVIQALSVIPGVSRAAASIIGGLIVGLPKNQAIEFSFLLSLPLILAASVYDLSQTGMTFSPEEIKLILIGTITAFVTAVATIKWFIRFVNTKSLSAFGYYRIILAVIYYFLLL